MSELLNDGKNKCHLVKSIRTKFLQEYAKNPHLFEAQDVERIKEDDWLIERYIIARCYNEENSLHMLIESMKWRKEFGVIHLRDDYFPREYYAIGGLFPYCNDRQGNVTLYVRVKMVKKIPELNHHLKMFLVHNINKIDLQTNGSGWVLIVDVTDACLSNCDLDLLFFLITTLKNYFPAGLRYILAHQLPWVLQGVWKLAKKWVPEERRNLIKFTSSADIVDYIDLESLPDFMGGKSKRDYKKIPKDCPDGVTFAVQHANLSLDRVYKIMDQFKQYL